MKKIKIVLSLLLVIFLAACGNSTSTTNSSSSNKDSSGSNKSASSDKEKYVLKVSHAFPQQSMMQTFMEWYDEELQKRSNGRLSLEIYPSGQLMPPDQEIPAILQGQIDISHSSSPALAGFDPIWNFYQLPFLFNYDPKDPTVILKNRAAFNASENGGQKIVKQMEEKGIKVLAMDFIDIYGPIFTVDEKDMVTGPDTAKGLKIRTPGGEISTKAVEALGASSVSILGAELTTALQQGLVDGALSSPIYAFETHLPVKTATVVPMFFTMNPTVMSMKKFESLPKDLQDILVETGKDLEEHAMEVVVEKANSIFKQFEDQGVKFYYPTEKEITEWKKATKPARDLFADKYEGGKELLDEVNKLNLD